MVFHANLLAVIKVERIAFKVGPGPRQRLDGGAGVGVGVMQREGPPLAAERVARPAAMRNWQGMACCVRAAAPHASSTPFFAPTAAAAAAYGSAA